MKLLMFSCDKFKVTEVKQSSKAPKLENSFLTNEKNSLLIFIHINSKKDEEHIQEAVDEIKKALKLTKYKKIILCPFAHLDFKIAKSKTALKIIKNIEKELSKTTQVTRVHFGSDKRIIMHLPATIYEVMFRTIPKPVTKKTKK